MPQRKTSLFEHLRPQRISIHIQQNHLSFIVWGYTNPLSTKIDYSTHASDVSLVDSAFFTCAYVIKVIIKKQVSFFNLSNFDSGWGFNSTRKCWILMDLTLAKLEERIKCISLKKVSETFSGRMLQSWKAKTLFVCSFRLVWREIDLYHQF
jgi:hypothetical protein